MLRAFCGSWRSWVRRRSENDNVGKTRVFELIQLVELAAICTTAASQEHELFVPRPR